jgi:hypothetical protein
MNTDEEQQGRPRALGDLIEYAPDRWIKASAVIAIEPLEGGATAVKVGFRVPWRCSPATGQRERSGGRASTPWGS